MIRPGEQIVEAVAPSRDVDGLPISDGISVRNVAHMETRDTLRLPRDGAHSESLVAVKRYYDGANGGEAGHYLMVWVEFRSGGSRWRTPGVKIRQEEAARAARDMLKLKPSKPGRKEAPRVGGKVEATGDSELHGVPIGIKPGTRPGDIRPTYLFFVRHHGRNGEWVRTRGVELIGTEMHAVANLLGQIEKAVAP
jgi:hypothetical protein